MKCKAFAFHVLANAKDYDVLANEKKTWHYQVTNVANLKLKMAGFFVTSSHFILLASYCILAASFSKRFILKLFAFAKYSNSFVTKLAHSKHLSKLVNSVKCGIIYSVFQRLFLLKYNTFSFHSQADVTCEKVHDGGSTCNYDNETILMSFMSAT